MGKAQSKRSVDITTEVKKDDVVEEGTGKMGKIEDVDQLKPQVNGDTHHNESDVGDKEKSADTEGNENEKDLSTEKEQQPTPIVEPKANLEGGDDANKATTPTDDENKPVENGNGNDDTLNDSQKAAETTENGGDSSKKPKKEKVKKKWSLRSISFGKKDKQKPPKKEETTTNGECEKVPEEAPEEAAKNGDATVEENAAAAANTTSADEKSQAVTPATESTTPAADATPAAESTPVLNGTSLEPAKDDKPIAEVAPTVVVEDKAPEPVVAATAEEPPKKDAAPEPPTVTESAPAVASEPTKIVEAPVPAKIEVNAETIQDETNENKPKATTPSIEQPQQQGDIDNNKEEDKNDELNKNSGGDSESAQNLPPPPLPCTSPPSQVSVFALSDDNKETSENEQAPTSASIEEKSQENAIEEECIEKQIIAESATAIETNAANEQEIVPASQDESAATQDLPVPEQSPVNSEKIAETIALIDEVTQQAAINVNNPLVAEPKAESESPAEDQKPVCENPTIESEVSLPTAPSHPEEQPSTAPEQISISESSTNVEEVPATSTIDECAPENSDKTDTTTELIGDHGNNAATQPAETHDSSIDAKDDAKITPTEEKDSAAEVECPVAKVSFDETTLATAIVSETDDAAQVPKSKENGFGENHTAETSATESLNGEHKTIEEMKSDCSEKLLNNDATTEVAAGAIEVKE